MIAMTSPLRTTIALVGLRCSGKSSVGRELAQLVDLPFVDLDEEIVRLHGEDAPALKEAGDVLASVGVDAFRDLEQRALEATLDADRICILATGGGVIERQGNRDLLRERTRCVWLDVEPEELARRMQADPTSRPALLGGDPVTEIETLLVRRHPHYAALAELRLDAGRSSPGDLAGEIARWLAG